MALARGDVLRVINLWIGVQNGYLGDFSYRTHTDFYPVYCGIDDVDPSEMTGTTRDRFERILLSQGPERQAAILRGVLKRFPPGSDPAPQSEADRGEVNEAWMLSMLQALESESGPASQEQVAERNGSGTATDPPPQTPADSSETVARTSSRAIRIHSIKVVEGLAREIADSSPNGAEVVVAEMVLDAMDVLREYVGEESNSARTEAWLHLLSRAAGFLSGQLGQLAELGLAIRDVVEKYR